MATSKQLALLAAKAALDKKADHVVVMDVREVSGLTDYFVICTAENARLLKALEKHIGGAVEQAGGRLLHTEGEVEAAPSMRGEDNLRWLLMDCGDIVVHLMDQATREFYQIERLWADAPRIFDETSESADPPAPLPTDEESLPRTAPLEQE